jgi:O-acetyl-ADP-ribose deacetylase (regulator of RNase III)
MAAETTYVTGDATDPQGDGLKVIVHCCNNLGVWGAGFVMALSRKWERPEAEYKKWAAKYGERFRRMLGSTLMVPVEEDIIVANLVGQEGVGRGHDGKPPVRYEAIFQGLTHFQTFREQRGEFSVHMPRMGCGLAGGDWNRIEEILAVTLNEHDIPVTVYDLPGGPTF